MKRSLYFLIPFLLLLYSCGQPEPTPPPQEMGFVAVETSLVEEDKKTYSIGEVIDDLNGIPVYYNGYSIHNTSGRHLSADGYNYGLKWQCVEFVKRYYFDHFQHRMPNPWGHAKDFFNLYLPNGAYNKDRDLYQWRNGSKQKPRVDDIVVFGGNQFGHVAIVSKVKEDSIEIVQQNVGADSRTRFRLTKRNGRWYVRSSKILGWLTRTKS
ncbi:MAG: CHAP domain-containing protein [Bacteroidota bacterium]